MVAQEYEFKVGDNVKIRKDSKYYGKDADSNPADVLGEVAGFYSGQVHSIEVEWGSGWNYYRPEDLELVDNVDMKSEEPDVKSYEQDTIQEMRDRIYAIDEELKSLQEEREKLVEVLREEGLVLLEKCKEPELDMTDWRNWKVGDIVYLKEFSEDHGLAPAEYPILEVEGSHYFGELPCRIGNNSEDEAWPLVADMKWVSRPKA